MVRLRPRLLVLLVLLVPIALAGCVNPAAEAEPIDAGTDTVAPDGLREPVTTSVPVSRPVATPVGEPDDAEQGEVVVVGENATLLVEGQWSCLSPSCGFHLILMDADGNVITSEQGVGGATLQKALKPGTYIVGTASSGPAVGMSGEIRATEFDGAVPQGFSAF